MLGKDTSSPWATALRPVNGQHASEKVTPLIANVSAADLGIKAPTYGALSGFVQPNAPVHGSGASTSTERHPNEKAMDPQREWLANMIAEMSDRGGGLDSDSESNRNSKPSSPLPGGVCSPRTGDVDEAATTLQAGVRAMNGRREAEQRRSDSAMSYDVASDAAPPSVVDNVGEIADVLKPAASYRGATSVTLAELATVSLASGAQLLELEVHVGGATAMAAGSRGKAGSPNGSGIAPSPALLPPHHAPVAPSLLPPPSPEAQDRASRANTARLSAGSLQVSATAAEARVVPLTDYPPMPPNAARDLMPLPLPLRALPSLQGGLKVDTQTGYSPAPLSARPQLDVTITLELPSLKTLWSRIIDRNTAKGVDQTSRKHETEIVDLLRAAKAAAADAPVADGGDDAWEVGTDRTDREGAPATARAPAADVATVAQLAQLRPYGTQLSADQRQDVALLAREMRRFERLRTAGFEANKRGDHASALRTLHQAALIKPSCAMLLSVANMHMKCGHPTLAAPLYYSVMTSGRASEREKNMAAAKIKGANAKARDNAGLDAKRLGGPTAGSKVRSSERGWTAPTRSQLMAVSPAAEVDVGALLSVEAGGHYDGNESSIVGGSSNNDYASTVDYASSRSPPYTSSCTGRSTLRSDGTCGALSSVSTCRTPSSSDPTNRTLPASTCRTVGLASCASGSTVRSVMPYHEPGGPSTSVVFQFGHGPMEDAGEYEEEEEDDEQSLPPRAAVSERSHLAAAWEAPTFDAHEEAPLGAAAAAPAEIEGFFEDDEDGGGLFEEMLEDPDLPVHSSPELMGSSWAPPQGWLKPSGDAWPVLSKEWKKAVHALPTLQAVLENFPQLDGRWQALFGKTLLNEQGEELVRHELPLRTVCFIGQAEPYRLLPQGETLGFAHLQMHSPAASECLLSLLLSALYESDSTAHLAPCVGWALIGRCEGWTPSDYEADELGPLPLGAPASLCIWQRKGVSLVHLFCPPPGDEPFDFNGLYPDGLTPPPPGTPRQLRPKPPSPKAEPEPAPLASQRSTMSDGTPIPGLGLWRLPGSKPISATEQAAANTAAASAGGAGSLPPHPSSADEAYGDFALFAVAHTLALLQAALELQHNELHLGQIQLLPSAAVTIKGVSLAEREVLVYEWGEHKYAFRTPALIPVVTGMGLASARLDGVLIDTPAPTLLPPLTETLDLQAFWKKARSQVRCGELVRRRLHALLMQGASYDAATADPWEQYRLPPEPVAPSGLDSWFAPPPPAEEPLVASARHEFAAREAIASLQSEWMPEVNAGRDCSCELLTRLRSDALLTLRDRARAAQAAEGHATVGTARPRPGQMRGKASAEVLQDLYLRAKVREAEEAKRKEDETREERRIRQRLLVLTAAERAAACANGWDGLQEAIEAALGDGTWARAVNLVPDEWEEEEAIEAFSDILLRPETSEHVHLLVERD